MQNNVLNTTVYFLYKVSMPAIYALMSPEGEITDQKMRETIEKQMDLFISF